MANKVKYNLKNVHWAKLTLDSSGNPTFGTVHEWPGAVSLSLDAQGETTPFYADGIVYYNFINNNGYSGDFESALVPELFKTEILGETKDANGVLVETKDAPKHEFALLFEFDGDEKARRHVMYRCAVTRPGVSGQTNEENITPQTETVTITATALPSGPVKASTTAETGTSVYDNWYTAVFQSAGGSTVRISGDDVVVKDSTITLTATCTPSGSVNWSTNNSSVATVSDGVVSGVAVGKATIMATLTTDGSVYDTKVVTVVNS